MGQSFLVRDISAALLRPFAALILSFVLFLSVTPVAAQSVLIDGGVDITYPPAGSVLRNDDVIYFNPGAINIHE